MTCTTKGTNIKEGWWGSIDPVVPINITDINSFHSDGFFFVGSGTFHEDNYIQIGYDCVAWFTYAVSIPSSLIINHAAIRLYATVDQYVGETLQFKIYGNKNVQPNIYYGISQTTNTVDWTISGGWPANTYKESPNIACIIQELVEQSGWGAYFPNGRIQIIVEAQSGVGNYQIYDSASNVLYQSKLLVYGDTLVKEGVKSNGYSSVGKAYIHESQGGISISGASDIQSSYVMQGGIHQNGGSAGLRQIFRPTPSGGISPSGTAILWPRISNIDSVCSVALSGVSQNDHSLPMYGGIYVQGQATYISSYVMQGGITWSGQAEVTGLTNEEGHNGICLDGSSSVNKCSFYQYEGGGELLTAGEFSGGTKSLKYIATGGVNLDNSLDPSTIVYEFFPSIHFLWRVNANVVNDITFVWHTGATTMYWYRIIGKGRQGNECDLVADPCCQKFILNIHARSPAELCEKLKSRNLGLPIESVQRFSKPAVLGNGFDDWRTQQELLDRYVQENGNCEELTSIEICKVPECAEFCINYDLIVQFEFDIPVLQVDGFHWYESGNGIDENIALTVGGAASSRMTRNITQLFHLASGQITLDGSADAWCSIYEPFGGIVAGGEAYTESSRYFYEAGQWPSSTPLTFGTVAESVPLITDGVDIVYGDRVWLQPQEALVIDYDDGYQIVDNTALAIVDNLGYSNFLVVKGFNLNIPDDVEIIGLQVQMMKLAHQINIYETHLVLVYENSIISNNLASNFQWPYMSGAVATYGSNGTDGNTAFADSFDANILRDPEFGVAVRVHNAGNTTNAYARVSWIQIQVIYQNSTGQLIRINGSSGVVSSAYSYAASGGLEISAPEMVFSVGYRYITQGHGSGTTGIVIRGNYSTRFWYTSTGSLTVSSSATSKCSFTHHVPEGGISMGGEALLKPIWETPRGGIIYGGSAAIDFYYLSEAVAYPIYMFGEAGVTLNISRVASGSIEVGAEAERRCSFWSAEASGEISISGEAGLYAGILLENIEFEFDMVVTDISAAFSDGIESEAISVNSSTVSRCGCTDIPFIIAARHNFIKNNIFYNFLMRNNYPVVDAFAMRYNSINQSWQANYHYRGLSPNNSNQERWDVYYELQCTDLIGGTKIGRTIWKLGINVSRSNIFTQESYDSHIVVALLPESICETNNYELDFNVILDTQTESIVVKPTSTVYQVSIYDNIGLFKNTYWFNNPDLNITVSQKGLTSVQNRLDLTDLVYI